MDTDTIAAIATASGNAGIGVIRVSGNHAATIAEQLTGQQPEPRYATLSSFRDSNGDVIDSGIALFFPGPHSFTGQDVLELQAHGGSVVMDMLLREVLSLGARLAKPGEFSQRAFLNDKIDLLQAEAIADVIESRSETALRSAQRSLSGEFSRQVYATVEQCIRLRVYAEAAIDFPDEEIDLLEDQQILSGLDDLESAIDAIHASANQGCLLKNGLTMVITGKPNAGKSSLLNQLAGSGVAIVSPEAGTTRDAIREDIQISGMPVRVIDTAGIRDTDNAVELEGVERARAELDKADIILLVVDLTDPNNATTSNDLLAHLGFDAGHTLPVVVAYNKIDCVDQKPSCKGDKSGATIKLSAKSGDGIDLLKKAVGEIVGFNNAEESGFIARRRHLDALSRAQEALKSGKNQLLQHAAGELLAEDLRQVQHCLGEITGAVSPDDLLGEIFSSFCIGK